MLEGSPDLLLADDVLEPFDCHTRARNWCLGRGVEHLSKNRSGTDCAVTGSTQRPDDARCRRKRQLNRHRVTRTKLHFRCHEPQSKLIECGVIDVDVGDVRGLDLRSPTRDLWADEAAIWDRLVVTWAGLDAAAWHLPGAAPSDAGDGVVVEGVGDPRCGFLPRRHLEPPPVAQAHRQARRPAPRARRRRASARALRPGSSSPGSCSSVWPPQPDVRSA